MFSTGRLIGGAALAVTMASVGWAQSVVPADRPMGSLRVPGTTAALAKAVGIARSVPRGRVMLDVIRVAYDSPMGADAQADERRRRLRSYLVAVSDVERARRALQDNRLSASLAQAKATRRPIEDFARAIGAKLDEKDGIYRIALPDDEGQKRRQQLVQDAGLDVSQIATDFNRGATVTVVTPSDEIPLPLDVEAWTRLVTPSDEVSGCLFTALVGDRRASLLYVGLASLDGPTRAYVASNRPLLEKLLEGPRPNVIATLGRSLRVRGGRVDVPGGAQAVPLWESLVERRVSEPDRFIVAILERDRGRLALLYDAVDHLDPPRQAFALSLRTPDGGARAERLKALYAAFEPALVGWDVESRPFSKVGYDGVHVLMTTRVLPSGELPSPAGWRFWETVFAGVDLPREPARELRRDEADVSADAVWLVGTLCIQNTTKRRQLVSQWLFGQRVFTGAAAAALPDVLVALRGFQRYPMLLLTLERMGVTDPAIYAASVRRAQRIGEIGNRDVAFTSLCQFQGALALIERMRFSRAITAETARQLVGTLAAVPMTESGEFQGSIAVWMAAYLLPAVSLQAGRHPAVPESMGPIEAALLTAMTRPGAATDPAVRVEWEGLRYRVDAGAADLARLTQVRQKQSGYAVDAVLSYCREVYGLPQALTAPAGVPAREAALAAVAGALGTPVSTVAGSEGPAPDWRGLLDDAARELRKIKKPKDLARVERIATPLRRAGDWLLAKVLLSLAYAPHLGDPEGPALMAGDPAQRHDFGLEDTDVNARASNPWLLPQESFREASGWRATGSVLGLDIGLARLALRRVSVDSLPPPPAVSDNDRAAMTAVAVLLNPFDVTDAVPSAVADAIRRGRARAGGLSAHPEALSRVLRAAPMGEWRQQALPWVLEREPDRLLEYFSLVDLVRLGEAEATPVPSLDAWGTSGLATEGCLCLRYPGPESWETFAGRIGSALVAERVPDLTLRVAESLATHGLPAQLVRAVMALAVQDVLDQFQPASIDDWAALVEAVRRIPEGRLEDYIAALTSGGPLIAADQESAADARR